MHPSIPSPLLASSGKPLDPTAKKFAPTVSRLLQGETWTF
jgi:hypothetical protein